MLDRSLVLLSSAEIAQQQQHEIKCGDGGLFVLKITPSGGKNFKNEIELHGSDGRIYDDIREVYLNCKGSSKCIGYHAFLDIEHTGGESVRIKNLRDFDFDRLNVSCRKNPEIDPERIQVSLDLADKSESSCTAELIIRFKTFRGCYVSNFTEFQFIKLSVVKDSIGRLQRSRGSLTDLLTANFVYMFLSRKTEYKRGSSIIVARANGNGTDIEFDCNGKPQDIKDFYDCNYPNIYIKSVFLSFNFKITKKDNGANGKKSIFLTFFDVTY